MIAAPSENPLGSPRFQPVRVLGEGGSGIVYEVRVRARSVDGNAPGHSLALKVLRADLAPSERERRRFLEEAERMQRLDSPGLVQLLEAGLLPDGRPYLAMPLLDGETLAATLRRGPVPPATAMRWFEVLARAVHAIHTAGMVHRDVKPENIMIVDDAPVLLDFGIARDIDDESTTTTAEGRVRGTPAYMAPERFFGSPASVRSDVYELGVVLYLMVAGRLPWGSEKNVAERLNPASPRDAGADVSSSLATVILKSLSTRPEMRPASADELAREVATAASELAAPSRRTLEINLEPEGAALDSALAPTVARDLDTPSKLARLAQADAERRARRPAPRRWPFVAGLGLIAVGAVAGMRVMNVEATTSSIAASSRAAPPATTSAAVAPAWAAAINPSANGKNASEHTTLPFKSRPASPAFHTAMRLESTRLI
jgi:serine/threonine-protein kinase